MTTVAKLKVYTLGVNGFIGSSVRDALGEPAHRRQARVLLVAGSKAAAVRLAEQVRELPARECTEQPDRRETPIPLPRLSDPEFRLASGNDVDALREAGLLDAPTVLVVPLDGWSGARVVVVGLGGEVTCIGTLEAQAGRRVFVCAQVATETKG